MSIAELSIRRPVTTIMLFVSMVVIGLIASLRLPLEALPSITFPGMFIQFPYPGSTPEEVERTVLRPAEEALATIAGIDRIDGSASADSAQIFILFDDWDRDIAIAASDARERLDAIRSELPDDLQRYFVMKFSTSDQPILRVRLASERDLTGAYETIERELKRPLERINGVARVEVSGAPPNEVEIAIDPQRMEANGVMLSDLTRQLQTLNFSISAGQVEEAGMRLRVQPVGEITELAQFRDLVLDRRGTRLGDIADVRLAPTRMDYGRRLDGRPAVGIDIYKERNANLVQVSRDALAELDRIGGEAALSGVQFKVMDDEGAAVTDSLLELAEAGLIGLVLSILVLYLFLRHWPSTLMVTLAIPICFVMTLGFMHFAGVTLNILSMMGLLLAVGMLVDNAVVVVESIYQEREKHPDKPVLASILGTRHVAIALSAGTLCHCIVFLPNLFGETTEISILMFQIAVTISVSLLASWLVAVSLIPMLSARMRTPPAVHNGNGWIARLQARYARLLEWTLRHRGWSVLAIVLMVVVSVFPMTRMKTDMFGSETVGDGSIYYRWNDAYSKEQMAEEVVRVERVLEANREKYGIEQIYTWYGEGGGDANTLFKFRAEDADAAQAVTDALREQLPKSARAEIGMGRQQGFGADSGGEGVSFQLTGDSTQTLHELADDLIPLLSRRAELADVRVDSGSSNNELKVQVDRERAAAFGFSAQDVAGYIGLALRGAQLREFRRGDAEVPVTVRFAGSQQMGTDDLATFMVRAPDGRNVPLLSLVNVVSAPAASEIRRSNRQTAITIKANLAGKTTPPEARTAIEQALDAVSFPPGYGFNFDGGFQRDSKAQRKLVFDMLLAFVLIYVVMAAVFESMLFPAAILSGVVFSIFGVFWLFWLTETTFSVMAFIGILVLMGVVVNNGIVMVEHINNLRRRGLDRSRALVEGSRERLRPILMTMGTAILAMVPISLGSTQVAGDGPPYYPMARAIAGGLAFSTVVTLLFLPTIYAILDDLRNGFSGIARRARGVQGPQQGAVAGVD